MVTITCDVCKGKKDTNSKKLNAEEWILGYDLQVESPNAVQRSIRFLDRWDDRRVLELGAIHLCSEGCREKYLKRSKAA
jgi:hypothetical protein